MRYNSIPGRISRAVFDIEMRLWDKRADKVFDVTCAFVDKLDNTPIEDMEDDWDELAVMILRHILPFGVFNYLVKRRKMQYLADSLYSAHETWGGDLKEGIAYLQSEVYHYSDRWNVMALVKCNSLFSSLVDLACEER